MHDRRSQQRIVSFREPSDFGITSTMRDEIGGFASGDKD
jgi:hypothetical protein